MPPKGFAVAAAAFGSAGGASTVDVGDTGVAEPDEVRQVFNDTDADVPANTLTAILVGSGPTNGTLTLNSRAASTTPSANTSQRMMPPNILTRTPRTRASALTTRATSWISRTMVLMMGQSA